MYAYLKWYLKRQYQYVRYPQGVCCIHTHVYTYIYTHTYKYLPRTGVSITSYIHACIPKTTASMCEMSARRLLYPPTWIRVLTLSAPTAA